MSPEAQRIAIAEACGWTRISIGTKIASGKQLLGSRSDYMGTPPRDRDKPEDDQGYDAIPNFPSDLNAMAEARKTLSDTQRSRYFEALHQVVGPIGDNPQWAMIDASAKQHAEAFLKTIEKEEVEK